MNEWVDKIEHKKFSHFISEVSNLLHKYDYAVCGDCSMADFEKVFDEFLKEWSVEKRCNRMYGRDVVS